MIAAALSIPAQPPASDSLEALLAMRPRVDRRITLEEAVRLALTNNPAIRAAGADVEAAAGEMDAARARRRAQLWASTFLSGGSNGNVVAAPAGGTLMALPPSAVADQNLALTKPLDLSGRLGALVRQAALEVGATESDRAALRQEVALLARTAFRDALARQALVEAAQARLTEGQARLALDRTRLAADTIPALYVRRSEAEAAEAQQALAEAQRDAQTALVQLKTTLGVQPDSALILAPATMPEPDELPQELPALLALAQRGRPELAAARQRVAGAREGEAAVRRGFRPEASLFAMSDAMGGRQLPGRAGATFGVTLSAPLATGGLEAAERRTAAARRQKEQAELERVALTVAQEVETALLEQRAARVRVDAARAGLEAAREADRIARLRYEAGRGIVTEALDAEAALVRARSALIQAELAAGMARDRLRRAVGVAEV